MAPTAAAASAKAPEATNLTKTQRRRIERKKRKEREVEAIKSVVEASPPVKVPTTAASKAAATAVKTIKVNDQRLRKALLGRLQASKGASDGEAATPRAAQAAPAATATSLQQKMKDRLKGARFRWINEKLYTSSSEEAVQMFREDPSIFKEYHEGFRTQVALWPQNPVDSFIKELKRASKDLVVADLGCGEAAIAASVPQKVHSFDLVAHNERVVACDIAHVRAAPDRPRAHFSPLAASAAGAPAKRVGGHCHFQLVADGHQLSGLFAGSASDPQARVRARAAVHTPSDGSFFLRSTAVECRLPRWSAGLTTWMHSSRALRRAASGS